MGNKNIVLLRGLNRGTIHWVDFPNVLKEHIPEARIEMIEIAGNGLCNNENSPIDPYECLQNLRSKVSFIKNGEKFLLVGVSLAGMLGLLWAETFPQDFSGLITINTSLRQFSSPWQRFNFKLLPLLILGQFYATPYQRELQILNATANNQERIMKFIQLLADHSEKHPTTFQNQIRQLILASRIEISKAPLVKTLVLVSEMDHLVNPKCSHVISEIFKIPIESHSTAGHDLPMDDPRWLAEKIKTFSL